MPREIQHEYTELATLPSAQDIAATPPSAQGATATAATAASTIDNEASHHHHSRLKKNRHNLRSLLLDRNFQTHAAKTCLYISLWYTFSGILSVYNKWLFGSSERDFSFPLLVSSVHMLMQYSLAALCLRLFPKLQPTQKNTTWGLYLTRAVPCGLASALDIGLSNISLRTITLTFYTMCKSSGLGFVLLFAFLFGLERVRFVLIVVIAIITVGVVLMAAGEVDFKLLGFTQVVSSAAMSGLRWSLTQILLSQARFGMNNPVATMSRLMPIIGVSMLAFSLILEQPISQLSRDKNMQSLGDVLFIVVMMGVGGCLAFAMVLSEFFLIARTSVVTLSIAGMLKEVVMIGVAHLIFGDSMTLVNASGLLVTLFGIAMYNWLKIHDTMNGQVDEDSSSNAHGDDSGGRGVDESQLRQLVFATDAYDEIAAVDFVFEEDGLDTQTENQEGLRGNNLTSNNANTSAGSDVFGGHSRFVNSPSNPSFSDAATKRTARSSSQSTDNSIILDHDEVTPGPMRLKNRE